MPIVGESMEEPVRATQRFTQRKFDPRSQAVSCTARAGLVAAVGWACNAAIARGSSALAAALTYVMTIDKNEKNAHRFHDHDHNHDHTRLPRLHQAETI